MYHTCICVGMLVLINIIIIELEIHCTNTKNGYLNIYSKMIKNEM